MARSVEPRVGERIAKLLARAGVASRREVERMIADGRVARGGVPIDTPATVLPSLDGVTVDGNPVAAAEPARLFLYHKPPGLLVTERDPRGRPTIYDRLPTDLPRLVPVGRLDLATEGLLLLTTDGELKRALELPATGVERTYRARVYGAVSQPALEGLIGGIEIDGFRYGPIDANMERRTGANSWIELRLAEGKNREVRRVLEYLGLEVSRLIRTRYGPFVLGDLPPGAVGEVRERDLAAFRQTLGKRGERVADIAPVPVERQRAPGRAKPQRIDTSSAPRRARGSGSDGTTTPSRLHPGAGRGPDAARPPVERAARPVRSASAQPKKFERSSAAANAPQLGPGLRRGGEQTPRGTSPKPSSPDGEASAPSKLQRKPGWAKPKIKPGTRPTKKR